MINVVGFVMSKILLFADVLLFGLVRSNEHSLLETRTCTHIICMAIAELVCHDADIFDNIAINVFKINLIRFAKKINFKFFSQ